MPLLAGTRLGPYEVEHLLGAGGMGEAYRGVDTRLGRAVALTVISQQLMGDESSRRRFNRSTAASALKISRGRNRRDAPATCHGATAGESTCR